MKKREGQDNIAGDRHAAIRAKKLTVKKGAVEILHELDLNVPRGKIIGLIGPSGSGKTTLMRAIVGVQTYAGALTVLGTPAGEASLRSSIGYVTQAPSVYGDLTVAQNIHYFAAMTGASKAEVSRAIDQVGLGEYQHQLVVSLSGGQRARVSLAVALLGNPELLVLDEPTVGLDPLLRLELWNEFKNLAEQGRTLLISSHVMDEAERCDELVLIRDGRVIWNDRRETLLKKTATSSVGDAFVSMIGGAA